MDPNQLITSVGIPFATAFAASSFKGATGPAQALDDVMTLAGFDKLNLWAEKRRAKQQQELLSYKEKIAQNISNISEENLQEPTLSIVGPALEASKYYIEEEEIRNMFARLISSSMDKSLEEITHTSFVEIIKQMTPLDADNLKRIVESNSQIPTAKILLHYEDGSYIEYFNNLYLDNPKEKRQAIINPSLDNLARLGLIEINYSEFKYSEGSYKSFYLTEEYASVLEILNISQSLTNTKNLVSNIEETIFKTKSKFSDKISVDALEETVNSLKSSINNKPIFTDASLKKGVIKMKPFGSNFCKTCL